MGVYSGWGYNLIYLIKNKVVYDCVYIYIFLYYILPPYKLKLLQDSRHHKFFAKLLV